MKDLMKKIKSVERKSILFATIIMLCAGCIGLCLYTYFETYRQPYMMEDVIDLSEGWQYSTEGSPTYDLDSLRIGSKLQGGETLTLCRTLDAEVAGAALLIRDNHQSVSVYLDGAPLHIDPALPPGENPGMALMFIPLPEGYIHKTLTVEITSPYELYAGRTSPILMGSIPSLEAYALSGSMRSVILMAMCLLIGFAIIALTFVQAFKNTLQPQNLAMGVFAVVWALYYVCTEYITFQFFTPLWVSVLSLGLYFTFQIPMTLYFYFSFDRYKRQMLPAVILHSGFGLLAILLQLLDIVDLPRLVSVNNLFLAGLAYTIVLAVLEAKDGNRVMKLTAPFFIIAYLSMLYNFYVFYTRQGVVPYTYKDTYFLLILCVLVYNVWSFFSEYYRGQREGEVLLLQNRLAKEGYEQIKTHLREVGGLRHEMGNHFAALQTYLMDGRYDDAKNYLETYAGQAEEVTEAVYHDHFLINAVAGKLLHDAQEQNIKVTLNLKPGAVRMADPDLYSLLSNILENALEACVNLPEGRERFIRLTVSRREPYLHITCENSYTGDMILEDGKIKTHKRESGHGYGLWTVEKIVDAYDGFMDIAYDEETFTLTVALKD